MFKNYLKDGININTKKLGQYTKLELSDHLKEILGFSEKLYKENFQLTSEREQ